MGIVVGTRRMHRLCSDPFC